jgi:hypothetical protein
MSKLKRLAARAQAADDILKYLQTIPVKVWGNWCGPNYGSGEPTDELDELCMQHDKEYAGDKIKADRRFVKRLRKMQNPTSLARVIALMFEHVITPMREVGLLDRGVADLHVPSATVAVERHKSDRAFSRETSVNRVFKNPGSYKSFISEKGVTAIGISTGGDTYIWKNGKTSSDPYTEGTVDTWSMSSMANASGDFPSNSVLPARWYFKPNTNRVYRVRLKIIGLISSTVAKQVLPGYGFYTNSLGTNIIDADFKSFSTNGSGGYHVINRKPLWVDGSTPCEFDADFVLSSALGDVDCFISPFIYLPTGIIGSAAECKIMFECEGLNPVGTGMTY